MQRSQCRASVAATAVGLLLAVAGSAQAAVPLTQVFSDPFTNASSQHRTAVEPDTFAFGATMVTATQSGRFVDGGGSGIGWATLDAAGVAIATGALPGITTHDANGGTYDRVSDPSVAYDAKHGVWMVSSIPITTALAVPEVMVNRSTDGGLSWGTPVRVAASAASDLDKNWTVCDNHSDSPFYGHCYTTWDDHGAGNRLYTSTSADGGLTWETPKATTNSGTGLGAQPVVQPNGTVIVPAANAILAGIIAYRSTDGGASWSETSTVTPVADHKVAGSVRGGPLPTAEVGDDGRVFVAWQDCRFRTGCTSNDIVYSTTTDGITWSDVTRVPIDATDSGVDHFIPGLAVTGSADTTKLGLTYYFFRTAACTDSCQLEVGYVQSDNGGSTWSAHTDVAGPFPVSQVPDTSQGRMVGDYISTSWVGGRAYGAFAVANAPTGGLAFDQALYVPAGGSGPGPGAFVSTSNGDRPVAGAASDHAAPRSAIRHR